MLSEHYVMRRIPILLGLVALLGSQAMLMEAPNYPVMCIARILQGISSSVIWVVGLALLCDTTPEDLVARPPVGGALYSALGPFVFAMAAAVLDLIARLFIIERKDALKWGIDPKIPRRVKQKTEEEGVAGRAPVQPSPFSRPIPNDSESNMEVSMNGILAPFEGSISGTETFLIEDETSKKGLSLPVVIMRLFQSSRASVAIFITFIYGYVIRMALIRPFGLIAFI
ncbi:hypothetical protein H0H81_005146 [Sphagnurus paluster]|uniref:Uncharacterized protein n=1 Tax=Sphagnurus paluster TaxID=117069 RepID=A0A9P7GWS7_9AGAR|nr:hypothetical protein H0H81_005146 [Sphagnurus paluster]